MFQAVYSRRLHYPLLLVAAFLLFFLNLGAPSLWDIDEGNNAEAAREMLESGDWVVPTFNYQLRVDKPALLYWLQMTGYRLLGRNEFSARLPSALAALLAVLVAYELGRSMFGATEGLLGGLVLASSVAFCGAAHFANPDALLCLATLATLTLFWTDYARGGRSWFWTTALTSGLGVLAKGPVGFILPMAVIGLFLLWNRRLALLRDRRAIGGGLLLLLVIVPWYAWVASETRGGFLRGFLLQHNVNRFLSPMESHRGSILFYPAVLVVGMGPWSIFLGWIAWFGSGARARGDGTPASAALPDTYRFLWCWIAVYLLFFSLSATKLPNYILPLYPPLSLLTARFLERWRSGQIIVPTRLWDSLGLLALTGVGVTLALLLVGERLPGDLLRGNYLPGLEYWAWIGLVPIAAVGLGCVALRRGRRDWFLAVLSVSAVCFTAAILGGASVALDRHKGPRDLVAQAGVCQPAREIRIGTYDYFQPSLVFYCEREIARLESASQTRDFLSMQLPVYLFVPESVWHTVRSTMPETCRVVARHYDLYRRCQVLVVSNG